MTNKLHETLVDADTLQTLLNRPTLRILDCRAKLGAPQWGRSAYTAGHIPGALHADLDQDLAAPPGARGRHPLPAADTWLERIRDWGIGNDTQVVVYDDAGGAYAARAWWMFRWVGHRAVALLNGGMAHWHEPLAQGPEPTVVRSAFEAKPALTRLVSAADIGAAKDFELVDARVEVRFKGLEEPIDPVAGHIPGAICLPFQDNLDANGKFKSTAALKQRFQSLHDPVVCYCGSGVTAAHNVLAMKLAGRKEPALYAGSWSEWITDPARPVEC